MWTYRARLVRCVDGDTFDADVDLGFHLTKRVRFRLLDVDTPERGEPGFHEATKALLSLIQAASDSEGYFEIETGKTGKYGRWLASIRIAGGTVSGRLNRWMKEHGL